MCPVASFKKYLQKLHHMFDVLWQRPLDSYVESNQVWYCRAALGKNTLGTMRYLKLAAYRLCIPTTQYEQQQGL